MNDDTWAEEYSALPPSTLAKFRASRETSEDWYGVHDYFEQREEGRTPDDFAICETDRFQDPETPRYRFVVSFSVDAESPLEAQLILSPVTILLRDLGVEWDDLTIEDRDPPVAGSEALLPRFTHPSQMGRIVTP